MKCVGCPKVYIKSSVLQVFCVCIEIRVFFNILTWGAIVS